VNISRLFSWNELALILQAHN